MSVTNAARTPARVPTLLTLAADACAGALKRGDRRVIAGLGDLHSDLTEVIANAYFPISTSSRQFLPALRALAESNALSPTSLTLSNACPPTLSRSGLSYLHLAWHSLTHLEILDSPWLDTLEPWVRALPGLTCLSLSGCVALPPEALAALVGGSDGDDTDAAGHREHHEQSDGGGRLNDKEGGRRRGRRQGRTNTGGGEGKYSYGGGGGGALRDATAREVLSGEALRCVRALAADPVVGEVPGAVGDDAWAGGFFALWQTSHNLMHAPAQAKSL